MNLVAKIRQSRRRRADFCSAPFTVVVDHKREPFNKPGEVKVWDGAIGEEKLTLKGHVSRVSRVAISADGRLIASGSFGGEMKVWDAATGVQKLSLTGLKGAVFGVAVSADGPLGCRRGRGLC